MLAGQLQNKGDGFPCKGYANKRRGGSSENKAFNKRKNLVGKKPKRRNKKLPKHKVRSVRA